MQILNVLITHLAPEKAARQIALAEAFTPGIARLIAYGGPREAFGDLPFADKVLLEDPSLRGPVVEQCFNEIFPKVWNYVEGHATRFDYIHVTEYDHLLLSRDYFAELARIIAVSGAEFLGAGCGIKTNSNWMHLFRYREDPVLLGYLRRVSVREDKTAICGTLGNGYTLSRRALQAIAQAGELPRVYNEVLFPTLAHHLGFAIDDFGAHSDLFRHVRWGPLWTEAEVRELIRRGAYCCHPFKDADAARAILESAALL